MPEVEIPQELGSKEDKRVGIKIAIIAVIMAIVSAYGKNAANDMIINEVKASNGYAWYQAKRIRAALNDQAISQIDLDLLGQPSDAQREAMGKLKKKLQEKNAEYKKRTTTFSRRLIPPRPRPRQRERRTMHLTARRSRCKSPWCSAR